MRRKVGLVAAALALGSCSNLSGAIGGACMAGGREAASAQLCSCVQQVANRTLTSADQRRAARFFTDPDRAQETRTSDRPGDEAFWDRYRAFADRAEATCG